MEAVLLIFLCLKEKCTILSLILLGLAMNYALLRYELLLGTSNAKVGQDGCKVFCM